MKRQMTVIVRGREHSWGFSFKGDEKYLAEWRADGLEVDVISNSGPGWVVRFGLLGPWCALQNAWNAIRLW